MARGRRLAVVTAPDPLPWSLPHPLETERLRLRPHRADDLDDLVVFHGDPVVTRYIPWPVRTREQTREALKVKLGQNVAPEGAWLVLAIEEAASGTVIGEVLLKHGADGQSEVGYVIRGDRQGLGLASEAVSAVIRLAFASFDRTRVEAVVDEPNLASSRLLERFGFVRDESLDRVESGAPIIGFVLTKAAWQSR